MEPRWTGPAHLLCLSRLADPEAPRDQGHPQLQDHPLYPMVLEVQLVHVYLEAPQARVSLADLVFLGYQAFLVVLCYLLILSGKAFHL